MARVGEPRMVQTAYSTFLARWPDNVTASIGLANSYYAAGDLNAAEVVLRRALARHPDSDAAMNNLAQALSDEGRDDEALALIERAVALAGPGVNQRQVGDAPHSYDRVLGNRHAIPCTAISWQIPSRVSPLPAKS